MARADITRIDHGTAAARPVNGAAGGVVRIGFVPLIDAAPLLAARELGLFEKFGVRVILERQIGWANVRDKLLYGHLDVSHAVLGMPLSTTLPGGATEPLLSVMELGSGGNAITLSKALVDRGVRSAATLARWLVDRKAAGRGGELRKLVFGYVFGASMHHYLLREWLSSADIHPDLDVRLCVVPPPQMTEHMRHGHLDGFCVGDPWNTLAERGGHGTIVSPTTDILPNHPEKVLAVTRRWADDHGPAVVAIIKALLQACAWCDDEANHPKLAEMLASERCIGVPVADLAASLRVNRTLGVNPRQPSPRPADWRMRSFAVKRTFPSATHAAWLAEQMIRWGHAPSEADVVVAATHCTDSRFYRQAAAELEIDCPADDLAPMPLRHQSSYDPRRSPYRGSNEPSPAGPRPSSFVPASVQNT
ncbi:CmpA/NrtA family ABC transporter substrate-binding protein [Humisphaera borealis]|uniref:ABC transporter substrate-binding protein n=1 Tax=Humisphaera borealis TaxID=2807512 RepID=A0A7M2WVW6_9BACT|nr:CmpA/NrtA family ABC transporter substrate-binding protein [Humisphaera borealis]QOV89553.1 ABC transporter substrate-binding protein [Humisphaera borealis]